MRCYGVLILLLLGSWTEANLLANADFTEPLKGSWFVTSTSDHPSVKIERGEVNRIVVRHDYQGKTSVGQLIPVTDLALELSFSARFVVQVNRSDFPALAEIAVSYYDKDTNLLGSTRFCRAANRVLKTSPEEHIIPVEENGRWRDYALNLEQELLTNLEAIESGEVTFIGLALRADNGKKPGC